MGIRTIAISTCLLLGAYTTADAAPATLSARIDEPNYIAANDTLESNETRRRKKIEAAMGGKKTAEKMAEGGIDFDPFSSKFMSERYNPYTYSIKENMKKQGEDEYEDDSLYFRKRSRKVSFWKRLYFQGNVGFTKIAPLSSYKFKPTITYGVAGGYHFNKLHSVRFAANFGRYQCDDLPESMWNIDLGVDYEFNLTNYMYGVNESRWVDISPVIGIGVTHSRTSLWNFTGNRIRAGLNVSRRLSGDSHIFVEPYFAVGQDQLDNSRNNPRRYDVMWGLQAGVRLDMMADTAGTRLYMPDFNPNIFFDLCTGVNQYWINGAFKKTMTETNGANYQFMVGKWFDPLLGMRLGLVSNDFYWRKQTTKAAYFGGTQISPEYGTHYRGATASARVELMFRPMNLFPAWRERTRKFEFDISGGFDLGRYFKTNVRNYGSVQRMFIGYTVAMDFLYKIAPGTSIFIEPRGQWVNFNIPKASYGKEGNYTDRLGSLNFGLRIQRPVREERENFFAVEFEPGLEVGVFGGSTKWVRRSKQTTDWQPNWLVGANLVYHITPYHSAMLEFEYDRMSQQYNSSYQIAVGKNMVTYKGFVNSAMSFVTAKLAYRLNLSNVVMERNWDRRRFNLYGFIGPTFSYHLENKLTLSDEVLLGGQGEPVIKGEKLKGKTSMGFCGGFISSYSLNKHLAVNFRPEAEYYFGKSFLGSHTHKHIFQVKINAGVEYRF